MFTPNVTTTLGLAYIRVWERTLCDLEQKMRPQNASNIVLNIVVNYIVKFNQNAFLVKESFIKID